MFNSNIITPAYGRDYKSASLAEADFLAGKDFIMQPAGCYCSIRDFEAGTEIKIRYAKMAKATFITVPSRISQP